MYEQFLLQAGLSAEEAKIYEKLLKAGKMRASKIAAETSIKRGMIYKSLDSLATKKLVKKEDEPGKVAIFAPSHPGSLRDLIEKRKQEAESTHASLQGVIGTMSADFNLISGKPNVQFYEGLEGVKNVIDDSLYAKSEILSYADIEAIQKYIPAINKWYVEQREKYGLKKRGIVLDTPRAREILSGYHDQITDTKFIASSDIPFHTVMQIYDNKVSYITLSEKEIIGVIIESETITSMHRTIFNFVWLKADNNEVRNQKS